MRSCFLLIVCANQKLSHSNIRRFSCAAIAKKKKRPRRRVGLMMERPRGDDAGNPGQLSPYRPRFAHRPPQKTFCEAHFAKKSQNYFIEIKNAMELPFPRVGASDSSFFPSVGRDEKSSGWASFRAGGKCSYKPDAECGPFLVRTGNDGTESVDSRKIDERLSDQPHPEKKNEH